MGILYLDVITAQDRAGCMACVTKAQVRKYHHHHHHHHHCH